MLENDKGGSRNVEVEILHWILQEVHENNLVNQCDQNENIFTWNYMSIVVWFQRLGFKIT